MIGDLKIVVVMPAYNAAKTLEQTYQELPKNIVDSIILVDDNSQDGTIQVARKLGIKAFVHSKNLGYGGNQKTCYTLALREGADVVVMIHPDYQYSPKLVTAMAGMVASGHYDVVLGSRILGGGALKGGMPVYKYISNRFLTLIQNLLMGGKLSEYHTGLRAFSRQVLMTLPLLQNSDNFVFDNQMLVQAVRFGFRIGEISCPTRYAPESSSIHFWASLKYGFGVLWTSLQYRLWAWKVGNFKFLNPEGKKLDVHQPLPVIESNAAAPAGE